MKREDIIDFLKKCGIDDYKEQDDEIWFSCMFAEKFHDNSKDRRPSASIQVTNGGESRWNCFVCGGGQSVVSLFQKRRYYLGERNDALFQWLKKKEQENYDPILAARLKKEREEAPEETVSEDDFLKFRNGVPKYIIERGITLETARAWGLRHDTYDRRAVFPFRDRHQKLLGWQGRLTYNPIDTWPPKAFTVGTRIVFGEYMLTEAKRIILVEGPIDALWVWQQGFRDVMAAVGSKVSAMQAKRIKSFGKPVIFFFDDDAAGNEGTWMGRKRLRGLEMYRARHLEGKVEPTDYSKEEMEKVFGNLAVFD